MKSHGHSLNNASSEHLLIHRLRWSVRLNRPWSSNDPVAKTDRWSAHSLYSMDFIPDGLGGRESEDESAKDKAESGAEDDSNVLGDTVGLEVSLQQQLQQTHPYKQTSTCTVTGHSKWRLHIPTNVYIAHLIHLYDNFFLNPVFKSYNV